MSLNKTIVSNYLSLIAFLVLQPENKKYQKNYGQSYLMVISFRHSVNNSLHAC